MTVYLSDSYHVARIPDFKRLPKNEKDLVRLMKQWLSDYERLNGIPFMENLGEKLNDF